MARRSVQSLYAVFLGVAVLCISSPDVLAYQQLKAGRGGADLHAQAVGGSPVVAHIPAGAQLNCGDAPLRGFFRCVATARLNGWVRVAELASAPSARRPGRTLASSGSGARPQMSAGLIAGLGIASAGATGTSITFGLEGTYHLRDEWSVGAYITYIGFSGTPSTTVAGITASATESSSLIVLAPEASYDLGQYLPGLRAVGIFGLGIVSSSASTTINGVSVSTGSQGGAGLAVGAGGAYDYSFAPQWTAGGEINLLYVTAGGGGTDFNFFASVRYWFDPSRFFERK